MLEAVAVPVVTARVCPVAAAVEELLAVLVARWIVIEVAVAVATPDVAAAPAMMVRLFACAVEVPLAVPVPDFIVGPPLPRSTIVNLLLRFRRVG